MNKRREEGMYLVLNLLSLGGRGVQVRDILLVRESKLHIFEGALTLSGP